MGPPESSEVGLEFRSEASLSIFAGNFTDLALRQGFPFLHRKFTITSKIGTLAKGEVYSRVAGSNGLVGRSRWRNRR